MGIASHLFLHFPPTKMYTPSFVVFMGILCLNFNHASVTAIESNATAKQAVKEEARTAFDPANPYKYQISHVGNYPPVSRSLYNVDSADADAPLLPPQQTYSREVSIQQQPAVAAQAPVARASSYGSFEKAAIGLGDSCSSDYECAHIKNNVRCLGGVCACGAETVQLANIACLPRAKHLGDRCVLSEQCKNLDPLATCYQDTCMCEPIYHVAGDIGSPGTGPSSLGYGGRQGSLVGCLKKRNLGESCKDTLQCAYKVYNSYCDARSRVCRCNFGFTPTGDDTCGPLADALGQPCVVDAQCANLMHADCGTSGTCQCVDSERFVQVQTAGSDRRKRQASQLQMCLPAVDLGQQCMVSAQCKKRTRNADCIGGSCQCVNGFVQRDPFVNECLPLIKGIGTHSPPCTISAQCLQQYSFCNKTTDHCDCDKAHCAVGYKCLPRVWHEEPCENNCQCKTPNTFCKEGWCQCRKGSCFSESAKMCLPKMLQFTANPFEFVAQCCGDLSRDRCIGQITFSQAFLNCSSKPKFTPQTCGSNPTILINENGGLRLSASASMSTFNNQNQPQAQQLSNRQVTATTTCTFTATTKDGLTATTSVIIKPEACCTQVPSATASTLSITLAKTGLPGACVFFVSPLAVPLNNIGNALNLLDLNGLFVQPCGERPIISSATQTSSSGFVTSVPLPLAGGILPPPAIVPAGSCMVMNGLLQFQGAILAGTAAQCVITTTTIGCNGQTAMSTTTFNLVCPTP